MKARLARLLGPGGEATVEALCARYAEPHRRYHNLVHIGECLEKLDLARGLLGEADGVAVELALWWHDAIYDARAADNEARSAALFGEAASRHALSLKLSETVAELILLTKTHAPGEALREQVMIDIDLSILGADPGRFAEYDAAIRHEYAFVPEAEWRVRRARVLRSFLVRPRIYATSFFRDACEAAARANLAGALAALD